MTFGTLTIVAGYQRMIETTDHFLMRVTDLLDRVLYRDPTLLVEIGTAFTVAAWSVCLLLPGQVAINPAVRDQMQAIPEVVTGAVAGFIAVDQAAAMLFGTKRWRAWASFLAGWWFGWLAGAFIMSNATNPNGYVYFGFACVSLLPFWRQYLHD